MKFYYCGQYPFRTTLLLQNLTAVNVIVPWVWFKKRQATHALSINFLKQNIAFKKDQNVCSNNNKKNLETKDELNFLMIFVTMKGHKHSLQTIIWWRLDSVLIPCNEWPHEKCSIYKSIEPSNMSTVKLTGWPPVRRLLTLHVGVWISFSFSMLFTFFCKKRKIFVFIKIFNFRLLMYLRELRCPEHDLIIFRKCV